MNDGLTYERIREAAALQDYASVGEAALSIRSTLEHVLARCDGLRRPLPAAFSSVLIRLRQEVLRLSMIGEGIHDTVDLLTEPRPPRINENIDSEVYLVIRMHRRITTRTLRKELPNIRPPRIYSAVSRLCRDGKINRIDHGHYEIVDGDRDA